jgi:hypothetical protein
MRTAGSFPSVKAATHPFLVRRLVMSGAMPLLQMYALMMFTVAILRLWEIACIGQRFLKVVIGFDGGLVTHTHTHALERF